MNSENLSGDVRDFCNLLVYGCEPYGGDPVRCYQEIFKDYSSVTLKHARELMERSDVKEYIESLRARASYSAEEMKAKITNKLVKIMDECSEGVYCDRRGTKLSPAALRSVSVNAAKALMEMYPVKVTQESKLTIGGEGDGENKGITFNVIVPGAPKTDTEDTNNK